MKKNILTTVAMATLLSGLSISAATAASSKLVISGNDNNTSFGGAFTVDLKTSQDVNLTFKPIVNGAKGSGFKVAFTNAGFQETGAITLCVGKEAVGSLFSRGDSGTIINGIMTAPRFQFAPDANESLIVADSNITFRREDNCSTIVPVFPATTEACQTMSAKISDGKTTQGTPFPDYNTNLLSIGKTKTYIKVACTPPECFVTADKLKFTESALAAGVNVALSATGAAIPNHDTNTSDCPECGETSVVNCVTTVTIENGNDFNITGLDLVANFVDEKGAVNNTAFKPVIDVSVDSNEKKAYSLGSKFSPSGLSIGKDANKTIQLRFTPNETDMIGTGTIVADITGMDSNISTNDIIPTFIGKGLATIKVGAKTQFTVPYMSAAGASQANFVKVSTLVGASTTPLSAVVSDAKGNSCNVTYTDVPANGGSTFIFASKLPTGTDYQALIPAGECTNLTSKLYSVKFTAGASVNAVGYMRTKRGERTISVF